MGREGEFGQRLQHQGFQLCAHFEAINFRRRLRRVTGQRFALNKLTLYRKQRSQHMMPRLQLRQFGFDIRTVRR